MDYGMDIRDDKAERMSLLQDTRKDGDATVTELACGCEHVDAPTYDAWFPCSKEHAVLVDTFNAKAAA